MNQSKSQPFLGQNQLINFFFQALKFEIKMAFNDVPLKNFPWRIDWTSICDISSLNVFDVCLSRCISWYSTAIKQMKKKKNFAVPLNSHQNRPHTHAIYKQQQQKWPKKKGIHHPTIGCNPERLTCTKVSSASRQIKNIFFSRIFFSFGTRPPLLPIDSYKTQKKMNKNGIVFALVNQTSSPVDYHNRMVVN